VASAQKQNQTRRHEPGVLSYNVGKPAQQSLISRSFADFAVKLLGHWSNSIFPMRNKVAPFRAA
jgi:hypothetical protein